MEIGEQCGSVEDEEQEMQYTWDAIWLKEPIKYTMICMYLSMIDWQWAII